MLQFSAMLAIAFSSDANPQIPKLTQAIRLPAERLIDSDIIIVGRLGSPLGHSINLKGKIIDSATEELDRAAGPTSSGGIFLSVVSVNGMGSPEKIVIRLDAHGLNLDNLNSAKAGDMLEMLGYETGEYCGTIVSNLRESIGLQPRETYGFYTRFVVLAFGIKIAGGDENRDHNAAPSAVQPLVLPESAGFDAKDAPNIRVRSDSTGGKSVYTRSADKLSVINNNYSLQGVLRSISSYKLDTVGKIISCHIYDAHMRLLYKVSYGYRNGRLERERMWDARVMRDYRNIYDRESPIQEVFYVGAMHEKAGMPIVTYTLDDNVFLKDYGSATTAFDPQMFDDALTLPK